MRATKAIMVTSLVSEGCGKIWHLLLPWDWVFIWFSCQLVKWPDSLAQCRDSSLSHGQGRRCHIPLPAEGLSIFWTLLLPILKILVWMSITKFFFFKHVFITNIAELIIGQYFQQAFKRLQPANFEHPELVVSSGSGCSRSRSKEKKDGGRIWRT